MSSLRSVVSILEDPGAAAGLAIVDAAPLPAGQVVGVSDTWRKLLMQVEMAAPHLQVASIEGEQGTGKYTLARYIFNRSPLAGSVFERRDAREWLATDGDPAGMQGFLYLERVDLLTPPGQNLLLGVLRGLQERPPGRAVLLVSSQMSLRQMAAQGLLLPDLAYRLTAIRFAVPPLRQRHEDIEPLAEALLERLRARYQQRPVVLGPGSLARLLQHNWPGNVRELAGVLESALLEAVNGVIRAEALILADDPVMRPPALPANSVEQLSLDSVIRRHVHHVLDLNHGNKLRAARQLCISRSTLYRLLASEGVPGK